VTIRVVLADDHDAVIVGLTSLLKREPDIEVVGTANGPTQLMDILRTVECDVLFTDLSMPRDGLPDGIQMIEQVRRQHPEVAIVVLTMVVNAVTLKAALRSGVTGLCDKAAASDDIVEAARSAVQGRIFLSAPFQGFLDDATEGSGTSLSPHEAEVVRLFGEGLSIAEIAMQLNRSKQTVSRQKRDAMTKLGVASDGELISYARSAGLAP
jgi:two-component system capsular synthesis response regulator RcsB